MKYKILEWKSKKNLNKKKINKKNKMMKWRLKMKILTIVM